MAASSTTAGADIPHGPTVEVGELLPRLDRGEKVLLLDVRNQEEYGTWKLEPRAPVETVHIPYFDFIEDAEASLAKVPRDRGEVVVLCAKKQEVVEPAPGTETGAIEPEVITARKPEEGAEEK